jgi:hypothetical protein
MSDKNETEPNTEINPVDVARRNAMDMINSMDESEKAKQTYHAFMETMITIIDQYPGNKADGVEMLMNSFQDAGKRILEGDVDDTPRPEKIVNMITNSIAIINRFKGDDPTAYHRDMKSVSTPLSIMAIKEFKDDDIAKQTCGEIISDFLERIFTEYDDDDYSSDDEEASNVRDIVTRVVSRDVFGRPYAVGIREVLPSKECYDLVSILYETYQEVGKKDLTEAVTEVIENWLIDNSTDIKSSSKT